MVAGIMMKSLLCKLATIMGKEFMRLKKLRRQVKFIRDELTGMKDALEGLSYMDKLDPQTKTWRDTVREMSYQIEDIIDDFMQNEGNKKPRGIVRNTVRRLKKLRGRYQIVSKIEDIRKLVLQTSARRERYKLDVPKSGNVVIDPRVATLYEDTAKLVGVEGPTNELLNFVMDGEKKLKVVSVVGFGGLGKTTLANVVYGKLKSQFCSAFVVVSRKPDIPQLLRSILFQLGSRSCSHECELNVLLSELREQLQHKRYLIIIDDVWNLQAWGVIKCAFPENDMGSRVIVTTRNQDLAKECCFHGDCILQMKPLSNEHSTRLFLDRTFGSEKPCPPNLGDVLVEILKKCGGLPLAIICISSMLAFEDSKQKERWEHVRNSLGSGTNPTLEGMRGILNLSYIDLPSGLKTCLLYLGMYPEDYIINRSNLEHQWIAEGFISTENGDVEIVARNYFNELVNRSLVQPVEVYSQREVTKCKVHDMMLDLILSKAAEENFLTIVNDPQDITGLDYNVRRLSIRLNSTSDGRTILPRNTIISQVRSAMFFGSSQHTPSLTRFKFLRVLFFELDGATIDLNGLCKLYQLRYLWTSYSCSYLLPKQIGVLQHLETIVLPSCGSLPLDIVHLPHLMLLYVDTRLPNGITNLKSLRHLYGFYFTVNNLDNVKGLEELTNLRSLFLNGDLYPEDRERCMDALCSSLGNLCNLETLVVDLDGCIDGLMPLSPPMAPYRLEKLVLEPTCWFSRVPSWMGELHNLSELECKVCELLNEGVGILAELPVLTDLNIGIREASNEMIVIYGQAFPALKCFKLQSSSSPLLTFQTGAMPKLQRLELTIGAQRSLQNRAMPIGIDNLLSLKELSATIGYFNATESEKANAESILKNAINMHPRSPQLVIDFTGLINQEQ